MSTETEKSKRLQEEMMVRSEYSRSCANHQPGEHLRKLSEREARVYEAAAKMVNRYFPVEK